MTIRRPHPSHWKTRNSRQREAERQKRRHQRRPLLETLEPRQLLAAGPQLAGIQPNDGALLRDGQVRLIGPRELVFHFNDGAAIDPATLDNLLTSGVGDGGLRLTRSGGDGTFSTARASSDFNTSGRVVVDFTARDSGESGNDIAIVVIKNELGVDQLPRIQVVGGTINVELNTTLGSQTNAQELVDAINGDTDARKLVEATIRRGPGTTDIATPPISYSPIVTAGANAASAVSNLGVGNALEMRFTANQAGPAGTGIEVQINGRDFGGVAPPRVTVTDLEITVEVNSNSASPTTAQELVDAINSHPIAGTLITATLPVGDQNEPIGRRVSGLRLSLVGIGDIPIVPGFVGLGASSRQVVMRFSDPLPDDIYRVEIIGSGPFALRNVNGGAFGDTTDDAVDDGSDFGLTFELDLGAQVLAVVPQPLTRNPITNIRAQFRDRINVYFNDDDLSPFRVFTGQSVVDPTVVDPDFYQLIFTNDTVSNTDDVVYHPEVIEYDPAADRAVLIFEEPLDELGSGPGTFRLRVGTDETLPLPPIISTASFATASSDFNTNGAATIDFTATTDFASGVTLEITKQNFGGAANPQVSVTGQHIAIILNSSFTNETTADQLATAINGNAQASQLLAAVVSGIGTRDITTPADAVTKLTLAGLGSSFDTATDLNNLFDTGRVIEVVGTGFEIEDEQTLTVTDQSGSSRTFEFDNGDGLASASNTVVDFTGGSTQADVTAAIVTAINTAAAGAGFDVTATATGNLIRLADDSSVALDDEITALQLKSQGLVLSSSIDAQPFPLDFPGDEDEPGHRDLRPELQRHFLEGTAPDALDGITTAFYNFQDEYGFDPQGNVLHNGITEAQKQRTREIFSLYAQYLGIQFVETANLGMTIVTGDLRGLPVPNPPIPSPGEVLGAAVGGLTGTAIMDLQDFSNPGDSEFGGNWFLTATHEIGHLLGLGHTDELAPPTILNGQLIMPGQPSLHPLAFPENTIEPIFPGDHDILHGQFLYSPDSKDIDLYRFQLPESGRLSIETFAERLAAPSMLNTTLSLYQQASDGSRALIARNDDYYSDDSYLELDLPSGTYWVGVAASGNDQYDPVIADTGLGGITQGEYDLRLNFRPDADRTMLDQTGVQLDGDADGVPGGVFNTWFQALDPTRTIFVDKAATLGSCTTDPPGVQSGPCGTLGQPYSVISAALSEAQDRVEQAELLNLDPSDSRVAVRILANGGTDGSLATTEDNKPYEIGFNRLGTVLSDGATMEVPRKVTVTIDSGAIIKLRRARLGVGSSTAVVDRSAGALQVLGTPVLLSPFDQVIRDELGEPIPGSVFFTSIHDEELGDDVNPDSFPPDPVAGDWGGVVFRSDIDQQDANRFDYEDQAIFLNVVSNADFRYGGGNVVIDGIPQVVAPIHITDSRPTIGFNDISQSADAAMSASPNSFEETNFHAAPHQFTSFTSDYTRVGPDIYGNAASNSSLSGLFVRVRTPAGNTIQPLTVPGRFDDTDLPHILADRLVVQGTPGGMQLEVDSPTVQLVTLTPDNGGSLLPGDYNYRVAFVDAAGNEGAPSSPTVNATIDPLDPLRSIRLDNLPVATSGFVARRIYRSDNTANTTGAYVLIREINVNSRSYTDDGSTLGRTLVGNPQGTLRARLNARLAIDPGVVVKLNGGGVETNQGADFYAEGADGREIVFTSIYDDRFGGGGTFDTTDDGNRTLPAPADWGGLSGRHGSNFSLDHALVAFGGGVVDIEGTFAGFNTVELHQAQARITHSDFENNGPGVGGLSTFSRNGRGFNRESTIFVRGGQPVVLDNDMINNGGAVISIDANSLNLKNVTDFGRSTYGTSDLNIDINTIAGDNQGPLVRLNRVDFNDVNGMQVRGASLTTEGVWDDTDITHVLLDETVYIPDHHTFGGLRLESSSTESLVVKLLGDDAGFTATGRPLDINDRIGGALHVVGQPSHPVYLTSAEDCTIGAGFTPAGDPSIDLFNTNACTGDVIEATGAVDVVVVIDESGSMFFSQQFMKGLITSLEASLTSLGVGISPTEPNQYGLAGFGGATSGPHFLGHDHPVGGMFFGTAAQFVPAVDTLVIDGILEDAYSGIQFALDNYPFRPNAEKFIILVTDEDRDIEDASLTFGTTLAALNAADVTLEGILDVTITDSGGNSALAADNNNTAYIGDGVGGFTTAPLGLITPGLFSPNTVTDYVDLVFATGGIVGDIFPIAQGTTNPDATSFSAIIVNQISTQAGAGFSGAPGDWDAVTLDQYSHDRNVEVATEIESPNEAAPGINAIPTDAEFLGSLAAHEKAGDENLRLGLEVHGRLSAPNDIDVYTFNGLPGTEVWLDIDMTGNSLDSVVELVDANGSVLARSDNALAESADPTLLFSTPAMGPNGVNPLSKQGYDPKNPDAQSDLRIPDRYSTNIRDAGMRVLLPGQPGALRTYYVRVRSSSGNIADINGGLTSGNYKMQVRLRETDEAPGSTVRYSDIRFAGTGIEILGQPIHSPLLGEVAEIESFDDLTQTFTDPNDLLSTPEEIGNLAQSDRGVITVSGDISDEDDVDFYELIVEYDSIQPSPPNNHLAAIFDIDYADGLARTNTELAVFDQDGRLILRSKGSNIADDLPRPLFGDDIEDLSRGSVGTMDPFLGPVELPAGPQLNPDGIDDPVNRAIYYVAVSSNAQMPDELRQYLEPNPPNPFVRLEPVNSVRRIAEDRIGFSGGSRIAEPPEIPILVDPTDSPVPFNLGDVTLLVSQDVGLVGGTTTTLHYVDPFTGALEATAGSFPEPIADIAIRGDGNLFAFSIGPDNFQGPRNDATIGSYVQIDTGDASTVKIAEDGIQTYVQTFDPASPAVERAPVGPNDDGVGVIWEAITFDSTTDSQFFNGFAVGTKGDIFSDNDPDKTYIDGNDFSENALFHFDINNGVIANRGPGTPDRTSGAEVFGIGTQKREFGEILTFTRIVPQFPSIGDTFVVTINGESISYTSTGNLLNFGANNTAIVISSEEEVAAGLADAWRTAALTTPEFAAFEVLNSPQGQISGFAFGLPQELRVRLIDPAFANVEIEISTINGDTGTGLFGFFGLGESMVCEGFGPGGRVTGIDSINGQMYAVTDLGGLYEFGTFPTGEGCAGTSSFGGFFGGGFSGGNLATYVRSSAIDLMTGGPFGQPIEFAGLTAGPEDVAVDPVTGQGRYADLLFGISTDGELYAFNTDGELQPIFVNNQTSVDTQLGFGVSGVEFSTLDRNLWTVTTSHGGDEGHGFNGPQNGPPGGDSYETFDQSRGGGIPGGSSFYFGNDRTTNEGGNQSFSNTAVIRDFNFAGGAHGSLLSNPFSLKGHSPADLPVMYFNYFLETEDTDYNPTPPAPEARPRLTRDAFRVFISDDNGEWTLLGTNNTFQDAVRDDEFDIGENDLLCTHPESQTEPCVQKFFDNTDWRQARIPLDRFAGRENLRLRFDFSSAGDMNLGDTFTVGSELRAISGAELRDAETFSLDNGQLQLEFDLGYTVVAPNGAAIQDGDSFTISPDGNRTVTLEFDDDGAFSHDIATSPGIAYRDGETFTVSRAGQTSNIEFDSGSSLLVPSAGANALQDGQTFAVNDVDFEFDDDGAFTGGNSIINLIVDQAILLPPAGGGVGGLTDGERLTINNGIGGVDVEFEFDSDRVFGTGRVVDLNNIEMQIPIAGSGFGGIADGDTFSISDGFGNQPVVFEFDKDNSIGPGNRVITVTNNSSQTQVVNTIITALQASGLGLNPVNQGGGVIRLGVFRHQVDTNGTATISNRTIPATADEIADRMLDLILNAGLGLTPTKVVSQFNPNNVRIRLGSTLHNIGVGSAPNLTVSLVRGDQDEMSNLIVTSILAAGLNLNPAYLGNGEIFLGQTTALDTSNAGALMQDGQPGLNDGGATAVPFTPGDSAAEVATSVATAVNVALSLTAPNLAVAIGSTVDLPPGTSFSGIGAAVAPASVVAVSFDADTSAEGIATNIENALGQAFTPVTTTAPLPETNDQFATSSNTGVTGGATDFQASGTVGDNLAFPFERGLDVDFVQMDLVAGDEVSISVTTPFTSALQPAVQLFNQQGQLLRSAMGGFSFNPITFQATTSVPQIDFTAITGGTYFAAISSSDNLDYNPDFAGSADVTLQVPTAGGALGGLTDGESFSIVEGINGTPVAFEFDRNGIVAQGAVPISLDDLVMELPAIGANPGGIQDGDFFIIENTVFEYDTDNSDPFSLNFPNVTVSPGTIPIPIDIFFDSAANIASNTAFEIGNTNLGLNPQASGNRIQLFTTQQTVDISGTPSMNLLTTPRNQQQIVVLMRDAIRTAGVGLAPVASSQTFPSFFGGGSFTFFTGGLTLDVRDHTIDTSLAPNLAKVIPTNTGAYDLSIVIAEPFDVFRSEDRINLPTALNITPNGLPASFLDGQPGIGFSSDEVVPINAGMDRAAVATATAGAIGREVAGYVDQIVAVSGGDISDGEIFSISDGAVTVNFEFENGFSLQIPDPALDPNAFLDGEFFTIGRSGLSLDFEFDDNGLVAPGNIPIRFNDLIIEVPTGGISEDFNRNGMLDLAIPEDANNNGVLDPGEDLNGNGILDFFNEDRNFNLTLDGAIFDGDTFTIDRGPGTPTVVFEYDTDGMTSFGNEVITVTGTADELEVANATVAALNLAGIGLDARVIGRVSQTQSFGGFSFVVSGGPVEIQLGIRDHNVDLTLTPGLTSRLTLRTQDEMGDLMVEIVGGAGLGMQPTYLGDGLIHLGGTATNTLDLSNAVTLSVTGLPGANDPTAIVIPVFPADTVSASDVAQLILSAINTAQVNRNLTVNAVAEGARRVNLVGSTVLSDFTLAPSLPINRSGDAVFTYQNVVNVIGHTIFDDGPLGSESALAGDEFGAFEASGPPAANTYPGALRGMDNAHEGVLIDDIIIGFAERGEMVVGAQPNSLFVQNDELLNLDLDAFFVPHQEIHVGEYELEIRRAEEFSRTLQDPTPEILLQRAFETNDRLTDATTFSVPRGNRIIEGQKFTLSDGLNTLTFEFNDSALNNGVATGNVPVPYNTSDSDSQIARTVRQAINSPTAQAVFDIVAAPADGIDEANSGQLSSSNQVNLFGNALLTIQQSTSARTLAAAEPNDTVVDAIDTGIGNGITDFTATGTLGDTTNLANEVDLFSVDLVTGQTIVIDIDANQVGSFLDPIVTVFDSQGQVVDFNDDFDGLDSFLQFTATASGIHYIGVSSFANFGGFSFGGGFFFGGYNPFVEGSGTQGFSTGDYTLLISSAGSSFAVTEFADLGDSNVAREQGQILIHSNHIRDPRDFGIFSGPGVRDGAGNSPHIGPARTTREVNVAGLVPGIVIANNVVSGADIAINFSGDFNQFNGQDAAIPFGRIVNNTLVGIGGSGTGISVINNVSPTLLNNIIADFSEGIIVQNADAVIGGTVYRNNGEDARDAFGVPIDPGAFPIFLDDTDPLFIDELTRNYYLAPDARAIDSSINDLQDRPDLVAIKSPLGIGLSPILAPDLDAIGQTRVDDPTVDSPPGQGGNVFKDRGALDRADFAGPTAILITPRDNDALGLDSDGRETFVNLTNQVVSNFSIQLIDGVEPNDPQDGTGADDTSVRSDRVTIFRDEEKLIEGVDYKFSYDATNNIIRITPLAGIWEIDRKYDIELSNSRGLLITAPNGTEVADVDLNLTPPRTVGDSFDLTDDFGNTVNFEFDSGYVVQVPQTLALQIPANGGAAITDRDEIIVTNNDTQVVTTFEFDLDGFITLDNVPIPFVIGDSANDIANAVVAAISTATDAVDLDLSPVNIVNFDGRAVHLGTKSAHDVDISNTSLVATGQIAGIEDGQTLTIDNGERFVTFEFTSDGSLTLGDEAIQFSFSQTNEEIAQLLRDAIAAADLDLAPTYGALRDGARVGSTNGLLNVGGETRHVLDATNSTLVLTGQPGATPEFGFKIPTVAGALDLMTIVDGEEFTIGDGTNLLTIEVDDDGVFVPDDPDSHPRVVVPFSASTTTDQFVNAISIAIRNGNVGLSPTNAGFGVVRLGGTALHTIDLANSSFTQLGSPGVPASIAVRFEAGSFFEAGIPSLTPIFSEEQMAQSIADAIAIATATGRLQDAVATPKGADINIEGITTVTGLTTDVRFNVQDIAGNPLKPNRLDGTTEFTIAVGSGVDYGDAPAPYPTLDDDNGARHEVIGDFFLGNPSVASSHIDVDFDGSPSLLADGDDTDGNDDEDGVVFNGPLIGAVGGNVTVFASASGFLDAWIDFNQDGDWDDLEEQIFVRRAVTAGANDLPVNVAGTAAAGDTYARFRLSSVGGLRPTGAAIDGEVEDHLVTIIGNPWHNAAQPVDVNADTFVVPLDVLLVINYINRNGSIVLPAAKPPEFGFIDVDGDGMSSPTDVLQVINFLNNPSLVAEGEAPGDELPTSNMASAALSNPFLLSSDVVVDPRMQIDDTDQQHELIAQLEARDSAASLLDPATDVEPSRVEWFASSDDADEAELLDDDLLGDLSANLSTLPTAREDAFRDW
jgi:hypothetical protein